MTSSRVDFSTRLATARASRGEKRVYLAPATTTSTIETIPPTTATPRAIVRKTTTTTAKPKAQSQPTSQPKPASQSKPASGSSSGSKPASSSSTSYPPMPSPGPNTNHETGQASWYNASYHSSNPWICAHRTLPMGTVITVTDVDNGRSITCEVGDRGPYGGNNRILDLSNYAFSQLANPSSGVVNVQLSW